VAKTILRRTILVVLASFIGLAPMGVGQVPGGGAGPVFHLSDAEDLEALSLVLSSLSARGSSLDLDSLEFRVAIVGTTQKLYKGSVLAVVPNGRSGFKTQSLPHYYLHRSGAPCAIPPDQLFVLASPLSTVPSASVSATPIEQVAFLIEVLDQLAEPGMQGPLASLARWFDASPTLVFETAQVAMSGVDYTAKVRFVEGLAPSAKVHAYEISAQLGRNGFSGWAVR